MEVVRFPPSPQILNIESKVENLCLQECSLKNKTFWKLLISLETYMKLKQKVKDYVKDLIFLENNVI